MPVKFSYSDLSETHDRLKREAQQYLDSLSVGTTSFDMASSTVEDRRSNGDAALEPAQNDLSVEDEDSDALNPSGAISEASGSHRDDNSHSTTDSDASDDDFNDMNFHQTSFKTSSGISYNDDDSLLAMAQRLDDASVISYSSFEVRDHHHECVDEDRRVLALPCSTSSLGDNTKRVTMLNSKLARHAITEEVKPELDSTAAAKGRRRRKSHRQRKYQAENSNAVYKKSSQIDSPENGSKIQPDNKVAPYSLMEKHQTTKTKVHKEKCNGKIARERRSDAKKGTDKTRVQENSWYVNDRTETNGHVAGDTLTAHESKITGGKKFYSVEKKNTPKISQWRDLDDVKLQPKNNSRIHGKKTSNSNQLNDSEYTIRTNNKNNKRPSFRKSLNITPPTAKTKSTTRARKSQNDSDDESMHGVGCNVRLHDKKQTKTKRESKRDNSPRSQSYSKARSDKDKDPRRPRSRSTPPASKDDNSSASLPVNTEIRSENEVNSVYDSDCNTEFFYESTDDDGFFSQGEEGLPAVGTSVLKAVEDLNSKSAVYKMKNLLGIRS
ncbi:hypothetical protein ACHAWX_002014 [Stephanocyclus meneghinianus]